MVVETTTWQHFQTRFSEWFTAVALFGWGVYLIMHPNMMLDPATKPLWTGLLDIMSQESWGLAATLTGSIRLCALYVNGHHHRTPSVRLFTSLFSMVVWTQVSIGFWQSGIANPAVFIYPCLVLADIYSAFRASGDVTLISRRRQEASKESRGVGTSKTLP